MGKLKTKASRDKADALRLQSKGRMGDTILAHINPAEARLLDQLADGLLDGGGRNPKTGLLSFGMSDSEGPSGHDSNPGGVGGGPAGGQTGGGIGGNTAGGLGGSGGGYDGSTVNGYGGYTDGWGGVNAFGVNMSKPSIANMTLDQIQSVLKDTWDTIDEDRFGAWAGRDKPKRDDGWAPQDTAFRALQEWWEGPPAGVPGRFGMPNAKGPGLLGTAITNLSGPYMSAVLGVGGAMGRASSQATQEASAAEMSSRGSRNSTGQQASEADILGYNPGGLYDEIAPAGTASGAQTAQQPQIPPGYTQNPAGQIIPLPGNNRSAMRDPIQNLLYDYLLRGGSGFGW
jgi:hypothetical protein